MFSNAIRQFSDNLNALREFTEVIRPVLESRFEEEVSRSASDLVPMMLAIAQLKPKEFDFSESQLKHLESLFDGDVKIEVEEHGEARGKASISVRGPGSEPFDAAMRRIGKVSYHSALLYRNSLIALVSAAEWFLSQILHQHFDKYPQSAGVEQKTLSLRELQTFESVEDARRFLIDSVVEEVLRGSFDDWMSFLKQRLNLSMGYLSWGASGFGETSGCGRALEKTGVIG